MLLSQLDHFVKERLRAPGYVRYADDMIVFGHSKRQMASIRDEMSEFLTALRLRLHPNKSFVAPTEIELTYLGYRISRESRRISQDGLRRANRNLRRLRWEYKQGMLTPHDVRQSLAAWQGHVGFANSKAIQKQILRRSTFARPNAPEP